MFSICFIKGECLTKLEIGRICMLCCAMLCYTILYYVLLYICTHIYFILFSGVLLIFYKPTKYFLIPHHPVAQGRASQLSCAWNLPGNLVQCICREDQGFCISSYSQVTSGLVVHRPQLSSEGLRVSNCQHISGRLETYTVYDFNEGSLSVISQNKYYPYKSGLFF